MHRMYSKTILIVDDEPRTRQGLKKVLDQWCEGKYQVIMAENGEEAIHIVGRQQIHVLLTDIRMPEMTGLAMLQQIRAQGQTPVVILISAYSEFAYAQEAIRLGVVNYLLKPISKSDLIDAVENALGVEAKQTRATIIEKVVDDKLLQVNEKSQTAGERIREAIHYIDTHLQEELTLKELADYIHLNPSYLSVLFKEQMELTFSEYVTRQRMQRAKELLISTSLPISDIAEQSGYRTAKYFIKIFKEMEGITPSTYRKSVH